MSEAVYKRAVDRKAVVTKELERYKGKISGLELELANLNSFLETWDKLTGSVSDAPPMIKATSPKNPSREEVGDMVETILRGLGAPLPRAPLLAEVNARGVEIYGKDPEMVFSTMLWRMKDRFVRLTPYGYWLAKEPYPPANYFPDRPQAVAS